MILITVAIEILSVCLRKPPSEFRDPCLRGEKSRTDPHVFKVDALARSREHSTSAPPPEAIRGRPTRHNLRGLRQGDVFFARDCNCVELRCDVAFVGFNSRLHACIVARKPPMAMNNCASPRVLTPLRATSRESATLFNALSRQPIHSIQADLPLLPTDWVKLMRLGERLEGSRIQIEPRHHLFLRHGKRPFARKLLYFGRPAWLRLRGFVCLNLALV